MKSRDIPGIFRNEANDLIEARRKAIEIHGTDIRAAGNEVELSVREYFKRMLAPRYYVTHGHLIDANGNISTQLDLIVADNFSLPSLITTKDGTEYIPVDSVYAVGEIKSTYYKSKCPIEKFSTVVEDIRDNLHHEEIPNTLYPGMTGDTTMQDLMIGSDNRILNYVFTFMLFVNGGDFDPAHVSEHYSLCNKQHLPNSVVLLDKGIVTSAGLDGNVLTFTRDPDNERVQNPTWYFTPLQGDGSGSLEGNHLGYLYWTLLNHLVNSHLGPPSVTNYMKKMLMGRRSQSMKLADIPRS